MKNIPQRTCIGCKKKKNKNELIRIVYNKNGDIGIEKNKNMQGRGAYICNNIDCLERAIKSKGIERSFKLKIDNEIYNELRKSITENGGEIIG